MDSVCPLVCLFCRWQKKQESKAPDKDAILKATASLSTRHSDRAVTQHNIRDVSRSSERVLYIRQGGRLIECALDVRGLCLLFVVSPVPDRTEEDSGVAHRGSAETPGFESGCC